MCFAGTATRDTHYLPVSNHERATFLNLRNQMTNLDPDEIKRVKLHPVKCSKCKLTEMVSPTIKCVLFVGVRCQDLRSVEAQLYLVRE